MREIIYTYIVYYIIIYYIIKMTKSLGENIAIYDNKIREVITQVIRNKAATINEYKKLKHIVPNYDESKRKTLEKILNERKQQIQYMIILKNKQNEALLKLLDYLNSLEKKDKKIHIKQILDEIKKLDKEIILLNDLIK
jgi:hypothetical protein